MSRGDFASERFFDQESMIWRVDREMALLLGGGRALLMQIAHPKVAGGVADHSRFRADPMGRLIQTMNTMWSIVFDDLPQAQASLQRIHRIHQGVQGAIKQPDILPPGTPYRAQDPDLLMWVHATLVDSAIATYGLFVKPMVVDEQRRYYDDTKKLAVLLGVPESAIPVSLEEFHAYMREMIESGTIAVGSTARTLAAEIVHPRPWALRLAGPLFAFVTTGLLPPRLREAYGLRWNDRKEKALQFVAGSARPLLHFVPSALRIVSQARAAEAGANAVFGRSKIQASESIH